MTNLLYEAKKSGHNHDHPSALGRIIVMTTLREDHNYDHPFFLVFWVGHENDNPKVYLVNWVIIT